MSKASFQFGSGPSVAIAILLVAIAIAASMAGDGTATASTVVADGAALAAGPVLLRAMIPKPEGPSLARALLVFAPALIAIAAYAALLAAGLGRPRLLLAAFEATYLALAAAALWRCLRTRAVTEGAIRLRALLLVAAVAQLLIGGRLMWIAILFAAAGLLVLLLPPAIAGSAAKYRKSGASAASLAETRDALLCAARDRELFRNPALALSDLASAAGVSASRASEALSQAGRTSFPELIAELRAEEAARLLSLPENLDVSLEPIGMEAGFRSRSNFYAAFKRKFGVTPAEYRSSVLK